LATLSIARPSETLWGMG
jgi:putative tryptophan/tyrosine transport system substrate-binding protein